MLSLRSRLFEARASRAKIPLAFCGLEVFIRQWSERERIAWGAYVENVTGPDKKPTDQLFLCQCVSRGLEDADGELIFYAEDVSELAEFPSVEIQKAFNAIIEANKVPDEDDAKKN